MFCEMVGICGGCTSALDAQAEIHQKQCYIIELFGLDSRLESLEALEVYNSPNVGFRQRGEFRIHREEGEIFLAMNSFGKNNRIKIQSCPILLPCIQDSLKALLYHLRTNEILESKLYAIEVLGARSGEVIISLIYHKNLDSQWCEAANIISKSIGAHIIGRSKHKKIILHKDFLLDSMQILSKTYLYIRKEGLFCQPNAYMNPTMIAFVKANIASHTRRDLLEMYCGDGNFCIALADSFQKIFATEIVKNCIEILAKNIAQNHITNITSARLSGAETISALKKERSFFRLKNVCLEDFCFSHILIDPPRSGINDNTMLDFISGFEHIIYISCNPLSLKRDLETLLQTHKIEHFGIFNQFIHTDHIECGVILSRI